MQDGYARRVEAQDIGRRDARRQELENGLRSGGDLRESRVDVDVRLEVNLHDAVAGERLQLDMLDVVDLSAQRTLVVIDDAAGHVVRRQAIVGPDHRDDRNADVRENVGRSPHGGRHAENDDQHRHHDKRIRLASAQYGRLRALNFSTALRFDGSPCRRPPGARGCLPVVQPHSQIASSGTGRATKLYLQNYSDRIRAILCVIMRRAGSPSDALAVARMTKRAPGWLSSTAN